MPLYRCLMVLFAYDFLWVNYARISACIPDDGITNWFYACMDLLQGYIALLPVYACMFLYGLVSVYLDIVLQATGYRLSITINHLKPILGTFNPLRYKVAQMAKWRLYVPSEAFYRHIQKCFHTCQSRKVTTGKARKNHRRTTSTWTEKVQNLEWFKCYLINLVKIQTFPAQFCRMWVWGKSEIRRFFRHIGGYQKRSIDFWNLKKFWKSFDKFWKWKFPVPIKAQGGIKKYSLNCKSQNILHYSSSQVNNVCSVCGNKISYSFLDFYRQRYVIGKAETMHNLVAQDLA